MKDYQHLIRTYEDFPKKGVSFKDLTPLVADTMASFRIRSLLVGLVGKTVIDYVVGVESRGFLFGCSLATSLEVGFVPVRKFGKLPGYVVSEPCELEYGKETLQIQQETMKEGSRVIIVDDILATGGTALATAKLIGKCKCKVVGMFFVAEIESLKGRKKLSKYNVQSLVKM